MIKAEFESLLDRCCEQLTIEAREKGFKSSPQFENRVREVLRDLTSAESFEIDLAPHPQAFPDIAIGEFGVEVKFTLNDTWRSVANSILETQRIESVNHIYLVFGKMGGGTPEVRWGVYEQSVIHVRTSHVPRFEVELPSENTPVKKSLFEEMGIKYDDFRKLQMHEKMPYIRAYARKIHPDGRLWWIEEKETDEHTVPIQARLYTNLSKDEKIKLRAEAALLCPKIVKSGRTRDKYDDLVLYLLTYHGVLCHQARDLFSAGSVANPKNDDNGGVYIMRALKLIEKDMKEAAMRMDDALFIEYWGESVLPENRISRWLEKADELAQEWKPSECLFVDG